ncbi:MAG: cupin domain-containing protein [Myxococcales bacterium]|nr:cupin domain-containing protein [Myxococcales bacterium]
MSIEHPIVIDPADHAVYRDEKMGKATLFQSQRVLVGLNCFEPGQSHALHAHEGMDKLYVVVEGSGKFLLEGQALAMKAGQMLVAPSGVPHGIKNDGDERLLVLAVLAPSP